MTPHERRVRAMRAGGALLVLVLGVMAAIWPHLPYYRAQLWNGPRPLLIVTLAVEGLAAAGAVCTFAELWRANRDEKRQ